MLEGRPMTLWLVFSLCQVRANHRRLTISGSDLRGSDWMEIARLRYERTARYRVAPILHIRDYVGWANI